MLVLLCLLAVAMAEPPVGDSYLEAAQSVRDHAAHQQYLPDLIAPSARANKATFNTFPDQHVASNSRVSYEAPDFRDISQVYGTPNTRNDASNFRNTIQQDYGAVSRMSQYDSLNSNLGQSFSTASKAGISQRYGTPSYRNIPSDLYGVPSQRSSPSTQYGVPDLRSTQDEYSQSTSFNRNSSPVQKYGVPKFQSRHSQTDSSPHVYGSTSSGLTRRIPSTFHSGRNTPSPVYGSPARSLSSQYGAPEARNAVYHEHAEQKYGAASGRSISQEYGEPLIGSSGLKTNAFASTYSSARSPSQEYGVPASRTAMPSEQYGPPQEGLSDQGYQYARNALDLLNQEPANYEFAYKVNDYESGSDFGHVETRQLDRAEGSYFVLLPDGTKQVVEYEADEDGYKPRISVEPAEPESTRALDGPY